MRILLTNDDGIEAQGLHALGRALAGRAEVFVAAPDRERSAVSHAVTLRRPVPVRPRSVPFPAQGAWCVAGTPADCVKAALFRLLDRPPDLVLSGVNPGINAGVDVLYSGTVAAAREALLRGVPSLAVSTDKRRPDFDLASRAAVALGLLLPGLGGGFLLNLNVPADARSRGPSLRLARQEGRLFDESCTVEERAGGEELVFTFVGRHSGAVHPPGSDCRAVTEGCLSLTALDVDLNAAAPAERLAGAIEALDPAAWCGGAGGAGEGAAPGG